jgi:hypothetical protein
VVIETLLARRLIEDDPRFGGRGRPAFLATTTDFLRSLAWARWPSCRRDLSPPPLVRATR